MPRPEILARLRQHEVLPTSQRIEIAELLLARPQHLSADQILDRLRENGSRISKATVYNTLNLFSEKGLVRELNVDPSRKFYDSTTHTHHHFYHVDTGELSDVPGDQLGTLSMPPLPAGTVQESIEILIRVRDK